MTAAVPKTLHVGAQTDLVWRFVDEAGSLVAPGDIASCLLSVFDLLSISPETPAFETAFAPTQPPFYATLQTDGYAFDAIGYNFRYEIDTADFLPEAGRTYRIVVRLTTTGGDRYFAVWDFTFEPAGFSY